MTYHSNKLLEDLLDPNNTEIDWDQKEIVREMRLEISKLEGFLDNYRGTCDQCGREDVLLYYRIEGYYSDQYLSTTCWTDRQECERIRKENETKRRKEGRNTARREG